MASIGIPKEALRITVLCCFISRVIAAQSISHNHEFFSITIHTVSMSGLTMRMQVIGILRQDNQY